MNLIDVIEMRTRIEKMQLVDTESDIQEHLRLLRDSIGSNLLDDSFTHKVAESHDKITDELAKMRSLMINQKEFYDSVIESKHEEYFAKSHEIYESMKHDEPEYIFERHKQHNPLLHDDIQDLFIARLGQYVTWQKPGLQIHPLFGEVTDHIKGLDPLYLADISDKMLFYVKTKWHEKYTKRLRFYTIDEKSSNPLHAFPKNQFGLIVSVGYFNYKPIEMVTQFLKSAYDVLCDGGVFVFTYNNASTTKGVSRVNNFFNTYIPNDMIVNIARSLGYEILADMTVSACSWLEIKKPGKLTSIRGGQTLAEIRSITGSDVLQYPSGDTFPTMAVDGEIFVRTDSPSLLKYRYCGTTNRWIQLDD